MPYVSYDKHNQVSSINIDDVVDTILITDGNLSATNIDYNSSNTYSWNYNHRGELKKIPLDIWAKMFNNNILEVQNY